MCILGESAVSTSSTEQDNEVSRSCVPVTTVIAATLGEFGLLIITGLVLLVVLYIIKISKTGHTHTQTHTHTHTHTLCKQDMLLRFILSCGWSVQEKEENIVPHLKTGLQLTFRGNVIKCRAVQHLKTYHFIMPDKSHLSALGNTHSI